MVENLLFASMVLIFNAEHHVTRGTAIACAVNFWARLAHALIYCAGTPVQRTLAFAVGLLTPLALVLAVFGKL